MFGWRRKQSVPIPVDPSPAMSAHARELLAQSKATRKAFVRVLNSNRFTRAMKRSLGKKMRKR